MSWTDERIERLKTMWSNGATASQIADELGGVSRNAVIGKAHRLGLEARPSPVKQGEDKTARAVHREPIVEDQPAAAPAPILAKPPAQAQAQAQTRAQASTPRLAPDSATGSPGPMSPRAVGSESAPQYRSVGPGGFVRQGPGDTQPPIPPAPPRRLVPAKPSAAVASKTGLLELNDRICKWPLGHPGEPDFHFCGAPANPGFPYCVQHCGVAYQAQLPRRDRRPPPPLPFGGPRVR